MSVGASPGTDWGRLTVALMAVYALLVAVGLGASDALALLFSEALFAGPVIIAALLSAMLVRVKARVILLVFTVGYSTLSAITFGCTFGFEHDAQYQLVLLLMPMLGFPSVIIAGLFAAFAR